MIRKLDIRVKETAEEVLNIQIPAYKVEADIIGSIEIPPLKDTVETLQTCGETFFGYYSDEQLGGVISIKVVNEEVDIHRLIVHPNHFRKGIAQALLDFIEANFKMNRMIVSTASKNVPAVRFYKKNGFQVIKEVMVNGNLSLTYFEKKR
ncbi:GNAT family N-acetyltransferase [Neobacillus sedimentimangrovi]|uniref:GNAT family N-acetyltransferase n=1 Tax=Neobacillus sedimentimangrovi TaxID=2699460 RepID=A0ABS8QIR4_9BACI|nr:GNAT family N-acetyltransferase [Neobacillus sedimentimangrovi]MCD4839028.1 GNAT family N-acetyltransferase [Neobacillus sedimentimangrovi]